MKSSRRGFWGVSYGLTYHSIYVPLLWVGLVVACPEARGQNNGTQFTYTTNNGTITIAGYTGPGGAVVIPSTISGLPVTSIGQNAFYGLSGLTSLTIPSSVTSIGVQAFGNCSGLANVDLGSSITNIGAFAFFLCGSLTSIAIPDSVTDIGLSVFAGCSALTNASLGKGVRNLGGGVFNGCRNLPSIAVDSANPFYTSLGGIVFNHDLTTIVVYPDGKAGTSYSIPGSVVKIGDYAFVNCSLTSVTIPNSVTTIGDRAFAGCINLTSIIIPTSVTTIGIAAFSSCTKLTVVTIPSSVTSIGGDAFTDCSSLGAINVDPANPSYSSLAGILFDKNQSTLVEYPPGLVGNYTVPDTVTVIGPDAFSFCDYLREVTISGNVRTIYFDAFFGCGGLTNVIIGSNVGSIGSYAFASCSSLRTVYLLGNAPSADFTVFSSDVNATAYYYAGSSGWGSTFGGIPAVMLNGPSPAGSLQVMIGPVGAINAGAQWRVDGGIPQASGATVLGLSAGSHTVSFSTLSGWIAPGNLNILVQANTTATATGTYVVDHSDFEMLDDYNSGDIVVSNSVTSTFGNHVPGVFGGNRAILLVKGIESSKTSVTVGGGKLTWNQTSANDYGYVGDGDVFTSLDLSAYGAFRITVDSAPVNPGQLDIVVTYFGAPDHSYGVSALVTLPRSGYVYVPYSSFVADPSFPPIDFSRVHNVSLTFLGYLLNQGTYVLDDFEAVSTFGFTANPTTGAMPLTVQFNSAAVDSAGHALSGWNWSFGDGSTSAAQNPSHVYANAGTFQPTVTATNNLGNPVIGLGPPAIVTFDPQTEFTYTTNSGTITITGYNGPGGPVSIPSSIHGLPVTSVGAQAFYSKSKVTSVSIPDTVISLGVSAFDGCASLTNVSIGANVTSIGGWSFDQCNKLTDLVIPNSVTNIGMWAFQSCYALSSITIPGSVTSIGDGAFANCFGLSAINVDASNPEYVSVDGILFDLLQTTLVEYPDGKSGTSYTIPISVTSIGNDAFWDCSLTSITIPVTVTNIGDGAFVGCRMSNITIPTSVIRIGSQAFYNCFNLTSITIPSSVTSLGSEVFRLCNTLTDITVDPFNPNYSSLDGVLFDKAQAALLEYPGGLKGSYTIPGSVTHIADEAFMFDSLGSVIIPNSVTNVGRYSLYSCASLTNVTFGTGVTSIGDYAFAFCSSLTAALFLADAPSADSTVFAGDPGTVYYLEGTAGWAASFGGLPTVLLVKPSAFGQSVATAENTPAPVTLIGGDSNTPPRALTYTVTANPAQGMLSGTAPNLVYTPNVNYVGSDNFQFKVNNGLIDSPAATVSITVAGAGQTLEVTSSVPAGQTATVAVPPGPGQSGLTATLNNTAGTQPVTIRAANYSGNPEPGNFGGLGTTFVDLKISGATSSDFLSVYFYYPIGVNNPVLDFYTGTNWMPVLSSGGHPPLQDQTPNLDGTISGGRFTVVFDGTSTPPITGLTGTVFALATTAPPVSSVNALPNVETTAAFSVCWSGSDPGPGIASYDIYVSTNGGPWGRWLSATPLTCKIFPGQDGHSYGFFSVARDTASSQEIPRFAADAQTTVLVSSAGDGIPDSWATTYGFNPNDPSVALQDPDGDRLSNLMEYALGTNPLNPADAKNGISISVIRSGGAQYASMAFKRRKLTPGDEYIPEVSADKQTWYSDSAHIQQISVTPLTDEFDLVTVQDATPVTAGAPRFMRLRVITN